MKYYLIAGERSGDLHGGNLIKAIRRTDTAAQFRGFGGEEMHAAGMHLHIHYHTMAFMGFIVVLFNLRKISKLLQACREDILQFQPDAVILIDYAGFNRRIAKFAKDRGIKVFYYIAPKVWAWNTGRAWELKANVDHLFSILPFEKEFFKKFDWDVDYVGNPVLDAISNFNADRRFIQAQHWHQKTIVALLPGSRRMELRRVVPVMAQLARANTSVHFVVAAVKTLPEHLYQPLRDLANVSFVYERTYDLLSVARAAIVTSGTAALETALFRVPQMVVYKAGAMEYLIGKLVIKVPFISLANLIANRAVIKEYIQREMNLHNLNTELQHLLQEGEYRQRMLRDYHEIYNQLNTGSASDNAAQLMVKYLQA